MQHIYCMCRMQVQLFPDGEMTISRESSDDLREGAFITDILPKIKGEACGTSNNCHRTGHRGDC